MSAAVRLGRGNHPHASAIPPLHDVLIFSGVPRGRVHPHPGLHQ